MVLQRGKVATILKQRQQQQIISQLNVQRQQQYKQIQDKINSLNNTIQRYIDDFNKALERGDKKRSGKRARQLLNERISDRTQQIKVLESGLNDLTKGKSINVSTLQSQATAQGQAVRSKLKKQRFKTQKKDVSKGTQELQKITSVSGALKKIGLISSQVTQRQAQLRKSFQLQKVTEKDLRNSLAQTFGKDLANSFKSTSLAELSGLYSSQSKENQRKEIENLIKASVPRTLTTTKQVISLNKAIAKEKVKQDKQAKEYLKSLTNVNINLTEAQKLESMRLNGESMTPTQQAKLRMIDLANAEKLRQRDIKILKNVTLVIPAYNYGINLRKRYEQGENNPLWNDFKIVSTGTAKEGRDIFLSVFGIKGIGLKGELDKDGIIATVTRASLEYEINVIKAIMEGKGKAKLKQDLTKIANATFKGLQAGVNLTEYVIKHPIATTIIVAGAIEYGIIKSKQAFLSNPKENLGRALFWLIPTSKILKGVEKLGNVVNPKFTPTTYVNTIKNLKTGAYKIKGQTSGVLKNGKNFKITFNLNYKPNTKLITGQQVILIGKKKTIKPISLIDKGTHYVDKNTGLIINKKAIPITDKSVKITTSKLTPKFEVKGKFKIPSIEVEQTTIRIFNGIRKVITKKSLIVQLPTKTLSKQILKIVKQTRAKKVKPLTNTQVKQLEQFSKSLGYELLKGVDKRSRVAKALGLKRTSKDVSRVIKFLDEKGKIKAIEIKRMGFIKTKGKLIERPKYKPQIKRTRSISSLRTNKKGQTSLIHEDKLKLDLKQGTRPVQEKVISIPNLTSKLPLTTKGLKYYGIMLKTSRVLTLLRKLEKKTPITQKEFKKTQTIIKIIKKDIIKIQDKIKIKDTIKIYKTGRITKTTNIPKKTTTRKTTIRPITPPKLLTNIVPTPVKLPKIKLLSKSKSSRQGYIIRIKQGNKIINKTNIALPKNRAINLMRNILDNTKQASGEIIRQGKTNIKDVKTTILSKKFRTKKGKNPLVRIQVEKRKYRKDSVGEKAKGFKLSKPKKNNKKK